MNPLVGALKIFCGLFAITLAGAAYAQAQLLMVETTLPSAEYQAFALAKDGASFAPDSVENKDLVDKGFGNPVAVRRTHVGYVVALAPSPRLLVPVPMGWRGFDDGKRTRIFTPAGNAGIVVNAMPLEGFDTWDETREQVWKAARQSAEARAKKDPRYQARLIRLRDGTFGMRESNIYEEESDPYSSVTLFRRHPDDPRMAVRVNLFAPVGDFERYLALVGAFMRDMQAVPNTSGLDRNFLKLPATR